MIALGIAVDDTIHFLHRYRVELTRASDPDQAIRAVFHSCGRAIIISTVALGVALAPLAFAVTISLSMLGTYLVVAFFGALVADLLCLPAMIHLGIIRYE